MLKKLVIPELDEEAHQRKIVNTIADKANEDQKIQDTKFDKINNRQ